MILTIGSRVDFVELTKRRRVIGQIVCPVLGVDAGQRPFFIE